MEKGKWKTTLGTKEGQRDSFEESRSLAAVRRKRPTGLGMTAVSKEGEGEVTRSVKRRSKLRRVAVSLMLSVEQSGSKLPHSKGARKARPHSGWSGMARCAMHEETDEGC